MKKFIDNSLILCYNNRSHNCTMEVLDMLNLREYGKRYDPMNDVLCKFILGTEEAEAMEATAIKDAFSAADLFMQDEEQRLAYVNREMAIMDYQSDMKSYRDEGREEGKEELIRNLLTVGTPIEYIRKASGWTEEAILALKNQKASIATSASD